MVLSLNDSRFCSYCGILSAIPTTATLSIIARNVITMIKTNMVIRRERTLGTPFFISQFINGITVNATRIETKMMFTTGAANFIAATIIIIAAAAYNTFNFIFFP